MEAKGDTWVDDHHTVEDTGLVLGRAFDEALGDSSTSRASPTRARRSSRRSRRPSWTSGSEPPHLQPRPDAGEDRDLRLELFPEFLRAFTQYGRFTLHLNCHYGENAHHKIESGVKALAVALRGGVVPERTGQRLDERGCRLKHAPASPPLSARYSALQHGLDASQHVACAFVSTLQARLSHESTSRLSTNRALASPGGCSARHHEKRS